MKHPELNIGRSESQKAKDHAVLETAKELEQRQKDEGYTYMRLNDRTLVLRKESKDARPCISDEEVRSHGRASQLAARLKR